MHLWLDTLSHSNRLRKLPPEHKLGFALMVLAIALVAAPAVQIAIVIWMSVWIVGYAKIPYYIYLRLLSVAIGFWLISVPALMISVITVTELASIQGDVLAGLSIDSVYLYLSHQGAVQAGLILARTIATVSCLYFVLFTTPFTELLQTARRFGCPAILTELLLLMYRFIFILLSTASEIWTTQHSRNGYRTRDRWFYSLSLLVSQLFRKTIEHYRQFVLSTAARGFNGTFRVWSAENYQPSKRYTIEASIGCVLLMLLSLFR